MAYQVEFCVPARPLDRADIEFVVRDDEGLFGTLKVSKGSLVWFPKNTIKGHKIAWSTFDRLVKEHVHRVEKR
jgi:hypothetical protein